MTGGPRWLRYASVCVVFLACVHLALFFFALSLSPLFLRGVTTETAEIKKVTLHSSTGYFFQPRRFFQEHLIGHFRADCCSCLLPTVCSVWRLINSTTVPTRPNVAVVWTFFVVFAVFDIVYIHYYRTNCFTTLSG